MTSLYHYTLDLTNTDNIDLVVIRLHRFKGLFATRNERKNPYANVTTSNITITTV